MIIIKEKGICIDYFDYSTLKNKVCWLRKLASIQRIMHVILFAHMFFARPFWKKLQSINGQTCMSILDKVARGSRHHLGTGKSIAGLLLSSKVSNGGLICSLA